MEIKEAVFNVVLALIVALPFVNIWLAGPIVWTALRTGRLLGRGHVYDRAERPAMYFGGIIFWFLLIAALTFMSALVLTHWLSN
jgi:uncharacterized membrane protein YedE/YeeE